MCTYILIHNKHTHEGPFAYLVSFIYVSYKKGVKILWTLEITALKWQWRENQEFKVPIIHISSSVLACALWESISNKQIQTKIHSRVITDNPIVGCGCLLNKTVCSLFSPHALRGRKKLYPMTNGVWESLSQKYFQNVRFSKQQLLIFWRVDFSRTKAVTAS